MSAIRGKDTKPELSIRKALHRAGFRYQLHARSLPGKPDLVFPRYQAVVFIHGCFWHKHECHLFKWPSSRKEFWQEKISQNAERDVRNNIALHKLGWRVMHVWECAVKGRTSYGTDEVAAAIATWLKSDADSGVVTGKE